MTRLTREQLFTADEQAIVHVMNRTVRRCYLLGQDEHTGRNRSGQVFASVRTRAAVVKCICRCYTSANDSRQLEAELLKALMSGFSALSRKNDAQVYFYHYRF